MAWFLFLLSKCPHARRFEFTALRSVHMALPCATDVRKQLILDAPALASVKLGSRWSALKVDTFLAVMALALKRPRPVDGAPLVITLEWDGVIGMLEALRAGVAAYGRAGWVTIQR